MSLTQNVIDPAFLWDLQDDRW